MKQLRMCTTVLLLVLLAGVLFACKKADSTSGAKGVTTVRVWANDAHNKVEYDQVIEKFNSGRGKEIGVQIEYTVYGANWQQALDIAVQAGEEPEVFKPGSQQAQHVLQGKLLPWTEIPGLEDHLAKYQPYHVKNSTTFGDDNVVYSIPVVKNVTGMQYNKKLLERAGYTTPPRSWAEWEEACVKISQLEPGKIFGYAVPLAYTTFYDWQVQYAAIPSVGHYFYDPLTQKYAFGDFAAYLELLRRLVEKKAMWPGIESLDDDTMRAQFSAGNIGFILGGAWNVGVLYDQFPTPEDQWDVMPMPVEDPTSCYPTMSSVGPSYSVSAQIRGKGTEFMRAVGEALLVVTGDELLSLLYTRAMNIPVRPEIAANAAAPSRYQWISFGAVNADTINQPTQPNNFLSLEGADRGTVISQCITGQARDIRAALADLDRRHNTALEKAFAAETIKKADFTSTERPVKRPMK
jgi:multiple sugar transport system substrate-binding protein